MVSIMFTHSCPKLERVNICAVAISTSVGREAFLLLNGSQSTPVMRLEASVGPRQKRCDEQSSESTGKRLGHTAKTEQEGIPLDLMCLCRLLKNNSVVMCQLNTKNVSHFVETFFIHNTSSIPYDFKGETVGIFLVWLFSSDVAE